MSLAGALISPAATARAWGKAQCEPAAVAALCESLWQKGGSAIPLRLRRCARAWGKGGSVPGGGEEQCGSVSVPGGVEERRGEWQCARRRRRAAREWQCARWRRRAARKRDITARPHMEAHQKARASRSCRAVAVVLASGSVEPRGRSAHPRARYDVGRLSQLQRLFYHLRGCRGAGDE